MPTLGLGRIKHKPNGFTLIELLVTMLIVGIVLAGVGLATGGFRSRDLEFEAERMAQLFSLAREEAQVRGRPLRMVADDVGYQFEALSENQWRLVRDDELLRARRWDQPTQIRIQSADRGADLLPFVQFGRDQLDVPFNVRLTRNETVVTIEADGMGRYRVEAVTGVVAK